MGNRISVQFKDDDSVSPIICSHWGGRGFLNKALKYIKDLRVEKQGKQCEPLDRLEAATVFVDFIRHITKDMSRVDSNLYAVCDESECDNSDNGHWVIDVLTGLISE